MAAGFFLAADFVGMGIAIVGAPFLALERDLVAALPLAFFRAVDEVALGLAPDFFFFVGVPIGMFMGIFDFEESCAVGCGC